MPIDPLTGREVDELGRPVDAEGYTLDAYGNRLAKSQSRHPAYGPPGPLPAAPAPFGNLLSQPPEQRYNPGIIAPGRQSLYTAPGVYAPPSWEANTYAPPPGYTAPATIPGAWSPQLGTAPPAAMAAAPVAPTAPVAPAAAPFGTAIANPALDNAALIAGLRAMQPTAPVDLNALPEPVGLPPADAVARNFPDVAPATEIANSPFGTFTPTGSIKPGVGPQVRALPESVLGTEVTAPLTGGLPVTGSLTPQTADFSALPLGTTPFSEFDVLREAALAQPQDPNIAVSGLLGYGAPAADAFAAPVAAEPASMTTIDTVPSSYREEVVAPPASRGLLGALAAPRAAPAPAAVPAALETVPTSGVVTAGQAPMGPSILGYGTPGIRPDYSAGLTMSSGFTTPGVGLGPVGWGGAPPAMAPTTRAVDVPAPAPLGPVPMSVDEIGALENFQTVPVEAPPSQTTPAALAAHFNKTAATMYGLNPAPPAAVAAAPVPAAPPAIGPPLDPALVSGLANTIRQQQSLPAQPAAPFSMPAAIPGMPPSLGAPPGMMIGPEIAALAPGAIATSTAALPAVDPYAVSPPAEVAPTVPTVPAAPRPTVTPPAARQVAPRPAVAPLPAPINVAKAPVPAAVAAPPAIAAPAVAPAAPPSSAGLFSGLFGSPAPAINPAGDIAVQSMGPDYAGPLGINTGPLGMNAVPGITGIGPGYSGAMGIRGLESISGISPQTAMQGLTGPLAELSRYSGAYGSLTAPSTTTGLGFDASNYGGFANPVAPADGSYGPTTGYGGFGGLVGGSYGIDPGGIGAGSLGGFSPGGYGGDSYGGGYGGFGGYGGDSYGGDPYGGGGYGGEGSYGGGYAGGYGGYGGYGGDSYGGTSGSGEGGYGAEGYGGEGYGGQGPDPDDTDPW